MGDQSHVVRLCHANGGLVSRFVAPDDVWTEWFPLRRRSICSVWEILGALLYGGAAYRVVPFSLSLNPCSNGPSDLR